MRFAHGPLRLRGKQDTFWIVPSLGTAMRPILSVSSELTIEVSNTRIPLARAAALNSAQVDLMKGRAEDDFSG